MTTNPAHQSRKPLPQLKHQQQQHDNIFASLGTETDTTGDDADADTDAGMTPIEEKKGKQKKIQPPPAVGTAAASSLRQRNVASLSTASTSSSSHSSLSRLPASSSSLLNTSSPTLLPVFPFRFLRALLYFLWKLTQLAICTLTFACGGCHVCGVCSPCRSGRRKGKHAGKGARRNQQESEDGEENDGKDGTSATSSSSSSNSSANNAPQSHHRRRRRRSSLNPSASLFSSSESREWEDWTEDDDSDFEYEPLPEYTERAAKRHPSSCSCCKFLVYLVCILLFTYVLFFVRVVPTNKPSRENGGLSELEVEFGFSGVIPPIGVPIPNQLHSSLHTLFGSPSRPGLLARDHDNLHAHFPVVFIPGIVSTGLEVWEGEKCAEHHFRQRLWGSTLMLRSILLDSRCWLRHLSLDGWSGLDPDGIKLRPASGLEAADYLVGGFWIWAKLIENFADIGYDVNSMFMSPYDWRLSFKHLQLRDYYFTKLKMMIEVAKLANHNRKVILIAHSMGGNVASYFLHWVESRLGGNGGPSWVNDHIESWVNIGVPWLGTPKVYSAIFSGEMKDTAELAPWMDYWRQRVVFSQSDVQNIMRTFRSLPSMFPKGGNVVWGDEDGAPDQEEEEEAAMEEGDPTASKKNSTPPEISPSNLGHFLSFTGAIPWPFPNITALVEEARRNESQAREKERSKGKGKKNNRNADNDNKEDDKDNSSSKHPLHTYANLGRAWIDSLRSSIASPKSSADPTNSISELNIEQAIELLKMVASGDAEFNDELYSFGFGEKVFEPQSWNKTREHQRQGKKSTKDRQQPPLDMLDISPSSPALDDQRYWANPLESPLPNAPHMKIFCLYGIGRETERGYVYAKASDLPDEIPKLSEWMISKEEKSARMQGSSPKEEELEQEREDKNTASTSTVNSGGPVLNTDEKNGVDETAHGRTPRDEEDENDPNASDPELDGDDDEQAVSNKETKTQPPQRIKHIGARSPTIPLFALNTSFQHPAPMSASSSSSDSSSTSSTSTTSAGVSRSRIRSGVKLTDGDGTVPVVSLGYMCVNGWTHTRWNPRNVKLITREYRDLNESLAILRSSTSVDHVDIMGNSEMITDLLYIAGIRIGEGKGKDGKGAADGNKKRKNGKKQKQQKQVVDSDDPSSSTAATTEDQSTYNPGTSESQRFAGEGSSSSVSEETASHDGLAGSSSSRSKAHPVGELTWIEVGERVFSQVRRISEKITKRWQERTGVKLEKIGKRGDKQQRAGDEDDELVDASSSSSATSLNYDWTPEDDALLEQLMQKKKQKQQAKNTADSATNKQPQQPSSPSSPSTPPANSDTSNPSATKLGVNFDEDQKRQEEEALEFQLEQQAESRARIGQPTTDQEAVVVEDRQVHVEGGTRIEQDLDSDN